MNVLFIDKDSQLEKALWHLQSTRAFAIDLEFDKNRYRYGFNLCLIQVATAERCYIIDPLSSTLQVRKLFPVLEDKRIQKVVFAFGEDLRLLHSLGCIPQNIFELSIAWQLLDRPHVSLAMFLETLLKVKINKSAQKSNWYKRPLSAQQMDYAVQDVSHLLRAKEVLEQQAGQKNIREWLAEENRFFDRVTFTATNQNIIREKEMKGLSEFQWFLFRKFMVLREELARRKNRPPYQMFSSRLVREIAFDKDLLESWEQNKEIFKALRSTEFKKRLLRSYGEWEREAVALGLSQTKKATGKKNRDNQRLSRKERTYREELKKNILLPLRELIAKDYGKNTAAYLLNNRVIEHLLSGRADKVFAYRRKLFADYARSAGFDAGDLFG